MAGKYDPINPVAFGAPIPHPNFTDNGGLPAGVVYSAVVGTNRDLMADVTRMWIREGDIVADVTYGNGAFWPKGITLADVPQIRHDIARDGVDCRDLPEEDNSLDVVVFDPPYRANHGGTLKGGKGGHYSGYRLEESSLDSINDVLDLYRDGIKEASRVVRPGGRIMIKCQDLSYSSRLHLVHLDVLRYMVSAGFELVDLFILVNTSRIPINGKAERQERSRRNFSYMLVGALPVLNAGPLETAVDKLFMKYGRAAIEEQLNRLVSLELKNGVV